MIKKVLLISLLTLTLCLGGALAEEEILGQPFPDFTAQDTQGNTYTLSGLLKDHEAVLINIWATWCAPCKMEMPYLNEMYEAYKDRVAFIALSKEPNDTAEKLTPTSGTTASCSPWAGTRTKPCTATAVAGAFPPR